MDKLSDRLVWLDMEMTGLDPVHCVPIEVAVIITDGQLNEIDGGRYEAVIHQPESVLEGMSQVVVDMHTTNGLLDKVRSSDLGLKEVDATVAQLISSHCEPGKALLAGNTIGQDRLFIRHYFPEVESTLHYRLLDVSSVKELVRRWYGAQAVYAKDSSHTAMADIRTSIAELAHYRKNHFREP